MIQFTKLGILSTLVVVLLACEPKKEDPPLNILIIHADQHRMDCIGAYGNPAIQTPNLDELAKDGVLYRNAYCSLPVCTPSRYSLLTGQHVQAHQGWTNRSTLNPSIETLPDLLKTAGYHTKAIGKMHFTPTYLDVGFEELILAEQDGAGRWDDDYHRDLMQNDLVDAIDLEDQRQEYRKNAPESYWNSFGTAVTNLPEEFYSTNWIAKHALESLDSWGASNNLLMVGFIKPHHPFDPPQKWVDLYNPKDLTLLPGWIEQAIGHDTIQHKGYFPNNSLKEAALRKSMAYYYASITQIDFEIGRMIKTLKEQGLYDNTLIIYTSDHGEHLGYHHQLLKGGYLYESIMKIPFIVKYPKGYAAGTESEALVSNIDVAPTVLNSLGLKIPKMMSGLNLKDTSVQRPYVFAHAWLGSQAMARSERYKLILNKNGPSLFFDLEKDPLELNNLFSDANYLAEIQAHQQAIFDWQGVDRLIAKNHLDQEATVIVQPNVRTYNYGHRDSVIAYFKQKMMEYQR